MHITVVPVRCGARVALWSRVAAIAAGIVSAAPAFAAGELSGVFANGSISYLFDICSTCDKPSDVLFQDAAGGVGSTGPADLNGFTARGTGNASVSAHGLLLGANVLPELGAVARAVPGIGPHPGFSADGAYLFAVTASALGRQYFTYTGTGADHYEITYTLSGSALNFENPPTELGNGLIWVSGGVTLFNGIGGNLETPLGQYIDGAQSFSGASTAAFRMQGVVGVDVNPGDSFYVNAFVAANVAFYGWGMADAGSTLSLAFTAGNTSALQPALQPVPEAPIGALFSIGLLALCAVRRRRRR
jgi:hypothetical protein